MLYSEIKSRDLSYPVLIPFYFWSITTLSVLVCLFIYYFVHCHFAFSVPNIFSFPWFFKNLPVIFSSYYRSQQRLWNFDTKTRFWGFASCIVSMCLFCSFSSPLPQYDSRWWLSLLLSPMMPQWCHSLLRPLSPSHLVTLSSLPSLLFSSSLCSSHPCGLVFHLHCLHIRSVKSTSFGSFDVPSLSLTVSFSRCTLRANLQSLTGIVLATYSIEKSNSTAHNRTNVLKRRATFGCKHRTLSRVFHAYTSLHPHSLLVSMVILTGCHKCAIN